MSEHSREMPQGPTSRPVGAEGSREGATEAGLKGGLGCDCS